MGAKGHLWSLTPLDPVRPATIVVQSICKHAPLRSIGVVLPASPGSDSSKPLAPARSAEQQPRPQPRQQQQQDAMQHRLQVLDWLPDDQQQPLETGTLPVTTRHSLSASSQQLQLHRPEELMCFTLPQYLQQQQQQQIGHGVEQAEQPQQQRDPCIPRDLIQQPASSINTNVAHVRSRLTAKGAQPAAAATSGGWSTRKDSRRSQQALGQPPPAAPAQPPSLYRLIAAAKCRHRQVGWAYAAALFDELQPQLPLLPFEQLAQAAWAAAAVSQRLGQHQVQEVPSLPTAAWQQSLLSAASTHFCAGSSSSNMSSGGVGEADAATLLQALVKLPVPPTQAWLACCCQSLAVGSWSSARALSTVAACLAQLGHVPSSHWLRDFFSASSCNLPSFPAISLARMLHGVVTWQGLHQQQQHGGVTVGQVQLLVPSSWLLSTLHSLCACSSQLKPPELAMLLRAMQQLQQQQQMLLPMVGVQPDTPLQQAAVQLQHALMAGVLQQLTGFGCRDLTVTLRAVAALQHHQQVQQQQQSQQQQPQEQEQLPPPQEQHPQEQLDLCCDVSWTWLYPVLGRTQVMLPNLDGRGQAAILTAAAALIKPHLHREQQQQQQQERQKAAEERAKQQQQRQQQQQQQQQHLLKSTSNPGLVRPVQQRLVLQQQHQAGLRLGDSGQQVSETALIRWPGTSDSSSTGRSRGASATLDSSSSSSAPGVTSFWYLWLDSFYSASLPALPCFSCEDLVQAATTLATLASVPPVAWYEELLAAVHKQIQTHLVLQQQEQRRSAHEVLKQGPPDQQLWLQQPDHPAAQVSHAQAAGIAWALGRMALLPSQHDPGVSLVPSGAWLSPLYAAADAGSLASAAARGTPLAAATQQQRQQVDHLHQRRTQEAGEVVRLMWAAAMCDFNPGDDWWRHAEQRLLLLLQHSQLPVPGRQQAALTTGEEATGGPDHLDKMLGDAQDPSTSSRQLPSRLLGALVQAYAASGRNMPSPVRKHLVMTAGVIQQLQHEPVTNALRLLRALTRAAGQVDQGWLLHLAAAFQLRLARLAPEELPRLVHCLAEAGLDLQQPQGVRQAEQGLLVEGQQEGAAARGGAAAFDGASWQQACCSAAWDQLPLMSATDVSLLLWGCAKMHAKPPPAWLAAMLQHMQLQFPAAKPSDLALGIDALSRLGYRPSADWLAGFMMATHRKFAAALSAVTHLPHDDVSSRRQVLVVQHILQSLWALAALQAPPNPRWLKQLLLLVYRQLPLLQPRHIAVLMLTLARLRCRPSPQFMQCMLDKLDDCSTCSSLDLLHVVYSAAVLRWQPNRQWLDKFLVALGSRLGELRPRGVALCHWSLGVLRVVPTEAWRRAGITAVSARLAEFDALSLGMVVWAWGRFRVQLVMLAPLAVAEAAAVSYQQLHLEQFQQQLQLALQQQQQSSTAVESNGCGSEASSAAGNTADRFGPEIPQGNAWWPFHQRQQVAIQLLTSAWQLRGSYSAASLVHMLAGVAKMHLTPGQAWLQDMVTQGSPEKLSVLNGYELQQLLWALAHLQYRASPAWLNMVQLLLEVRWQEHANTRHSADAALQQLQHLAQAAPSAVDHGAVAVEVNM